MSAVAPKLKQTKKVLSLQEFVELVQKLPPAKIAQLPLDRLPANIPSDITEQVPAGSRGAVEDLLLSVNSMHLKNRMADVDNYGEEIVNAMDKARTSCGSNTLRVFKNKISAFN